MKNDVLPDAFLAYYKTFPSADMNDLKLHHTRRVVENALRIMKGEHFPADLREAGETAAWLHDLGRFSQFRKYGTFSDRVSVNHALLSCAEVLRLGWLDDWSAQDRNRILRAIECHNMRDIPEGLSTEEQLLCYLVRDADKLDIFTVLDKAIETNYLETHPEVYWGLPFRAPPSDRTVASILDGRSVDYADIGSFADFIFIQVAWCNGGLHFNESRRMALERNELEIRRDYLCDILPEYADTIDHCCDAAEAALKRGL